MPSPSLLLCLLLTVSLESAWLEVRVQIPRFTEINLKNRFLALLELNPDSPIAEIIGFWAAGAASLVCPTAIPVVWGFVKTYPILLALAKAAIAFPLSYHYLAGIRHLVRFYILLPFSVHQTPIEDLKRRICAPNILPHLFPSIPGLGQHQLGTRIC